MSGSWVVGVDLGGTKIALGLVDPQDKIVARKRILMRDCDDCPPVVVQQIAEAVAGFGQLLPAGEHISALGICSPGPLDHVTGTLIDPPNLPGFHHTPIRQMLEDALQLPVSLEHDAKAAALGEYYFGSGRGAASMVYVVVGTGVGAAIIVNGELFRGTSNTAGEVGHITLDRDGELCSCGSRGCVETYISGPWISRRYQRAAEEAELLSAGDVMPSCTAITALAEQGDPLALRIMTKAGEALGVAVASMAMLLDVELYIIGGGVAHAGELLLAPANNAVSSCSGVRRLAAAI
ncbi:ROK family protein [Chloroflexota bacterium]